MFRVGAGSALNGSGDYPVFKTYLEYAPQVGQQLRLGSRLAYIGNSHPRQLRDGYSIPQEYRAVNIEQEIYWLPFGAGKVVEFGVGGGVVAGYSKQKSYKAAGFNSQQEFFYTPDNTEGMHLGYIGSLYSDVALNPARTWRLGGRVALQHDTRGTILPGGQLQLSRAW
ncbi:hypothetical protein GCM10011378_36510 [Hymenobacter glacieicola]|uniref:Bacterial surface antigen (D15) domain-containing protein n=1 Tax=Hymenobacter glacieicola TaxID=1562124 RepID=A0ABQ1X2Q3_9BACT|nr:hypothetical protein GCM10011378_36510 [Hymenobacter glacieicola]